ncbi:hypothetical protein KEM54_000132 [Ascosphaera aggregata]|nr:hypothetical protein KEM54_000132 [Ascosphaera aggregata]
MAGYHYQHSSELPAATLSRRDSTSTSSSNDSDVPEVLLAQLTSLKTDQAAMKKKYNVEKDKYERERLRRRINLLDDDIVSIEKKLFDSWEDPETDELPPVDDCSEERFQAGAVREMPTSEMEVGQVCKEAMRIFQVQAALVRAGLPRSPEEDRRLERLLKKLEGGIGVDDQPEGRDPRAEPSKSKRQLEEEQSRIISKVVQEVLDKQESKGVRIKQRIQLEKELEIQSKLRLESLGYGNVSSETSSPNRPAVRQHSKKAKQASGRRTPETCFKKDSADPAESDASTISSDRAQKRCPSDLRGQQVHFQREPFMDYSQSQSPSSKRIFVKIHRNEVELETLRYFGLPFCIHEDDPDHYVIEEWISESRQRQIFEHTAALRQRRALEVAEEERKRLQMHSSRTNDKDTVARMKKKKKKTALYLYRWA